MHEGFGVYKVVAEGEGEVCSSIKSHWREGGGGGRGSGEGCCCRDHQSWRIIIAKNQEMVFSSLSNEFLWVSFYRIIFRGQSAFMKYAAITHWSTYSYTLVYWNRLCVCWKENYIGLLSGILLRSKWSHHQKNNSSIVLSCQQSRVHRVF